VRVEENRHPSGYSLKKKDKEKEERKREKERERERGREEGREREGESSTRVDRHRNSLPPRRHQEIVCSMQAYDKPPRKVNSGLLFSVFF